MTTYHPNVQKKINLPLKKFEIHDLYVIDKYWPNFNFLLIFDQYPDIQGRFSTVLHEFNCYITGGSLNRQNTVGSVGKMEKATALQLAHNAEFDATFCKCCSLV